MKNRYYFHHFQSFGAAGLYLPIHFKLLPLEPVLWYKDTLKRLISISSKLSLHSFRSTKHVDVSFHTKCTAPKIFNRLKSYNYTPGPWFNIKMPSYQYRKSHCEDKTILRPSYLHNGISYTGKTTSAYWIGTLRPRVISCHNFVRKSFC